MSQKHWEDEVSIELTDESIESEEVMLSKAECTQLFREEVALWLKLEGPKLITTGMDLPKIVVKEPVVFEDEPTSKESAKTPRKKVKAERKLKCSGGTLKASKEKK